MVIVRIHSLLADGWGKSLNKPGFAGDLPDLEGYDY
jgi:hypothetical protein